jgi:membrane associated rhomboid family serine protease
LTETGTPEEQAPVRQECYRHPGRETGVRCTRCDRPICPDCMNDASVGFQCPECVKEGRKSVRAVRTAVGGRVSRDPGQLTRVIIGLNIVVFIASGAFFVGLSGPTSDVTIRFALVGHAFSQEFGRIGVATGEYYRLLTSAFLHGGLLHIALNMYILAMMGPVLERVLGRWRFLALYFASALGGSVASYVVNGASAFSVGASGAIYGLFGAYYVIARKMRLDTSGITTIILINLVFTFLVPIIDKWGHLGGLAVGGLIGVVFAYAGRPGRERDLLHAGAAAAAVLVLAVVAVVKTSLIV